MLWFAVLEISTFWEHYDTMIRWVTFTVLNYPLAGLAPGGYTRERALRSPV